MTFTGDQASGVKNQSVELFGRAGALICDLDGVWTRSLTSSLQTRHLSAMLSFSVLNKKFYFVIALKASPLCPASRSQLCVPDSGWCTMDCEERWALLSYCSFFFFFFFFLFYNCTVQKGFLPRESRVAFPGESQPRQSRATQPKVHAGCFSVSITHRTLKWTTGSLTCIQL